MGWAERLNPNSWRNTGYLKRREYARKNAARDREQFEDAMSPSPIPAALGVVPSMFKAFAALLAAAASSSLSRRDARKLAKRTRAGVRV